MCDKEFMDKFDEVFEYDEARGSQAFQELLHDLNEQGRHTHGKNSDVFHLLQFLSDHGLNLEY